MRAQSVGGRRTRGGRAEGRARGRRQGVRGTDDAAGHGNVSDPGHRGRSEPRKAPTSGRHVGCVVPAGGRRDGQPAAFGGGAGHRGKVGVSGARGGQVGAAGELRTVSHGGGADQSRGRDQTVARGEDREATQAETDRSRRRTTRTE